MIENARRGCVWFCAAGRVWCVCLDWLGSLDEKLGELAYVWQSSDNYGGPVDSNTGLHRSVFFRGGAFFVTTPHVYVAPTEGIISRPIISAHLRLGIG